MRISILLFSSLILAMTSCKKEYVCECRTSSTFPGVTPVTSIDNTPKMKKDDAKQKCNEGDRTISSIYIDPATNEIKNYTITSECELK